jgi:hypothetical protein
LASLILLLQARDKILDGIPDLNASDGINALLENIIFLR